MAQLQEEAERRQALRDACLILFEPASDYPLLPETARRHQQLYAGGVGFRTFAELVAALAIHGGLVGEHAIHGVRRRVIWNVRPRRVIVRDLQKAWDQKLEAEGLPVEPAFLEDSRMWNGKLTRSPSDYFSHFERWNQYLMRMDETNGWSAWPARDRAFVEEYRDGRTTREIGANHRVSHQNVHRRLVIHRERAGFTSDGIVEPTARMRIKVTPTRGGWLRMKGRKGWLRTIGKRQRKTPT